MPPSRCIGSGWYWFGDTYLKSTVVSGCSGEWQDLSFIVRPSRKLKSQKVPLVEIKMASAAVSSYSLAEG